MSTRRAKIFGFVWTPTKGSVGPGTQTMEELKRKALKTKENEAKLLHVLENLLPLLDKGEMQIRLGEVLLPKVENHVSSNVYEIHFRMLHNYDNTTLLKILKDFNFFETKVGCP